MLCCFRRAIGELFRNSRLGETTRDFGVTTLVVCSAMRTKTEKSPVKNIKNRNGRLGGKPPARLPWWKPPAAPLRSRIPPAPPLRRASPAPQDSQMQGDTSSRPAHLLGCVGAKNHRRGVSHSRCVVGRKGKSGGRGLVCMRS